MSSKEPLCVIGECDGRCAYYTIEGIKICPRFDWRICRCMDEEEIEIK